jgi:hypothetical protein
MKMRKTITAAAAALVMTAISAPATAFECEGNGNQYDPATIQANLTALAIALRCAPGTDANPGEWLADNPIWEKRGAPSCDVHERLARKLYEERAFEDDCSDRPRKDCKDRPPQNENNDATGAAWDVRNEKYEAAISKLDSLIADVMKSRLNRAYDPDVGAAQTHANELIAEVEGARNCIYQLIL